ncbi:TauD/TfdA family dioxygenase [Stigmatella aurantiaca]|nr:TauD/TfdA family dioxygenase [Stigmatella aurantiaca]ADO73287.1 Taurine catabolism dioxygenase TauD/TfdA [Stigmatella aurantiaca DW4/3-1]
MPSEPLTYTYSGEPILPFIERHAAQIQEGLLQHGAVRFKGFGITDASTFERAAKAIDPELKDDYLGTSPRNRMSGYVFSASELPPHFPIMQHCEMSFLPHAPRKLFFWCRVAPPEGGETPICDFAAVYDGLNPDIRREFEDKGITTLRNYAGPGQKGKSLKQLKPWPDMFLTTDKNRVNAICREHELEPHWLPGDALRLINTRPAIKVHPIHGKKVWYNHTQVFHSASAQLEYSHIASHQKTLRGYGLKLFLKLNDLWESASQRPEERAMHVTFGNGEEIPRAYVSHLMDVIWKNLHIAPWQAGDMIAIDNYRTAHGRLPYKGPREVNVCWAADTAAR